MNNIETVQEFHQNTMKKNNEKTVISKGERKKIKKENQNKETADSKIFPQ